MNRESLFDINASTMQHIADFLGTRDLCAMFATCAQIRGVMMNDSRDSRDFWRVQVRARFPHKLAQPAFIAREPEYNAREFLFLLEDRARDWHAAMHPANIHLAPEEVEELSMRGISCVNSRGIIIDICYVSQNSLILRGDIIHITGRNERFCIFDGVYARDTDASVCRGERYEITFPAAIKLGVEFGIEYFEEFIDTFDRVSLYIDPNYANYWRATVVHRGSDCYCELVYGPSCYNVRPAKPFADIDSFMQRAAYTSVRVIGRRYGTYELEFSK